MIEIRDVSYSYESGRVAIDNINLSIGQNEQIGLIGANGAGKTTLMKAILGLVNAQGYIKVSDFVCEKKSYADIRKIVGYVSQDSDAQMFMPTVIDDMVFGPMNYGLDRKASEKQADDVLEKLNIMHLRNRQNYSLSAGEKRMAAIATILTMNPKVIMMDEPSSNLDPSNRRILINTLNDIDVTKIIATHDLDLVLETCDKVILMNKGKIAAVGDAVDILGNEKLLVENGLELPFCMAGIPKRAMR